MSDAHDSHRQSVATWVTTGQRRFSTYPPSISVTSPATPGFPEPQIQMQYGNGQHEDDVDGEYPPSGAYGSHQLAAARGYEGVGYDQNQDASRVAGAELEDLDPDVDESFTIGRGTTNGMPTPNIPRSVPLPASVETSQHGFIPPHPLGPMYAGTAGSDIHAMDSPAEFARRPNDFSTTSQLRVQSSGKGGAIGATGRRLRSFARVIGRVLALASPMRIVNAVRRRRKPVKRSSLNKFPPEFEFRDPHPAPLSVRASMSAGAGASGRDLNVAARRDREEEEENRREVDLERGVGEGEGRQQVVTMIGLDLSRDENELRRTASGVGRESDKERDDALRMPGAMQMRMPTPMIATPSSSLERQPAIDGPLARPMVNGRSHSNSHRSNRTQGETGEMTAVHDSGLGHVHDGDRTRGERGRSRERINLNSPRSRNGSLQSHSILSPTSPVRPAQPPPSIRKSRSLSPRSMRTYSRSRSRDSQSTITHSSALIVHLRTAFAAILRLYHLPWIASPPHRLTVDFVPALSSARSKYRVGRRHGRASSVPSADLAAARANEDMREGESWYRLSPQQMAMRKEKRERARAERAAMRRSYGTGTTRTSLSRWSSDNYHRLADPGAAATLMLGGAGSPRRPPVAYVSPTQAAAQAQPPPFGGGQQYVSLPNGIGGQQVYVLTPINEAGSLPLPVTTPHGSPGSNRGEREGRSRPGLGGTMSPTRRLSILSGRARRHHTHGHHHSSSSSHGFNHHFVSHATGGTSHVPGGSPPQPVYMVPATYPPPSSAPGATSPVLGNNNGGGNGVPALPPNYVHAYPYPYAQNQQPMLWPPGLPPPTHAQAQASSSNQQAA